MDLCGCDIGMLSSQKVSIVNSMDVIKPIFTKRELQINPFNMNAESLLVGRAFIGQIL